MMRITILFLLLSFPFISFGQEIPKRLERKFSRDASRIALRIQSGAEELRYQEIVIPKDSIKIYKQILRDIYQFDNTGELLAKLNVHTYPNPSIDDFAVIYEREVEWAAPLREGINETDSEELNELLIEYDLSIYKHTQWNGFEDAISIRSKQPMNMSAIANELYNIEGVNSVDLKIPNIPGNDITFTRTGFGFEIKYILMLGSDIQGERKTHYWKYAWYKKTNSISFIGEHGDPLPAWMTKE